VALPELLANSPTPGTAGAETTLAAAITSTTATTISTAAPARPVLQVAGQFRLEIDAEVMLVTGGSSTTTWTVVRGVEGSTAATHASGAPVYHVWTAAGLDARYSLAGGIPGPTLSHLDAFGHSYLYGFYGEPSTVPDKSFSLVRKVAAALGLDDSRTRDLGVNGASLLYDGYLAGGLPNVLDKLRPRQINGPYVSQGGATLIMYGINDVGNLGDSTQLEAAFQNSMRALISRSRAAAIFEDTDASVVYSSGWTASTAQYNYASAGSGHSATTTGKTITITVPADFVAGDVVALEFIGAAGPYGGQASITVDGAAAGTVSTSSMMPSGVNHGRACVRLTGLAAGTHSVVITTTEIDSSGNFEFDDWMIEPVDPKPVVVCNIARLPAAGYAGYPAAPTDAMVANYNAVIAEVVAEFGGPIAVADIDTAMGKVTANFSSLDNVHPNAQGTKLIARAILNAFYSLPTTLLDLLTDSTAVDDAPGIKQNYGLAYAPAGSLATGQFNVLSEARATPIFVSEARVFTAIGCEITTAGSSGSFIRLAVHADDGSGAYPGELVYDAGQIAASTASSSGAGTLAQINGGAGILLQRGWYWLSATCQDTATPATYPTLRVITSTFPNVGLTVSNAAGQTVFGVANCYSMTGISGAWSAQTGAGMWTTTPTNDLNPPRVFLVGR
jgi:lysophospholipase L1-like esterase